MWKKPKKSKSVACLGNGKEFVWLEYGPRVESEEW